MWIFFPNDVCPIVFTTRSSMIWLCTTNYLYIVLKCYFFNNSSTFGMS